MKKQLLFGLSVLLCGGFAQAQVRSASEPVKLLDNAAGLMAPVWSPDGSKIAMTSDNYGGIFVSNADGTDFRTICTTEGAGYKMTWTEDGKAIVGRANIVESGRVMHEIREWNVENRTSKVLVAKHRNAGAPTLKAAGKKTASAGVYDIMTARPADAVNEIAALSDFAGKVVINPAISPDGRLVAFQIPGRGMWLINADGTGLRELGKGSHPAWMPDSRTLVYTIVEDNGAEFTGSTLMSLNVENGKTAVTLAKSEGMIPLTPAISPDGKKLAFENAADAAIYVINLKK